MKKNLLVLALALFVSMVTASAYEMTITSPAPDQNYYVWDEVPINFISSPGDGYCYTTYVNDVETDVFAPEEGGRYVVKVLAQNPGCEGCLDMQRQVEINVDDFPRVDKTRIVITSPELGAEYHVNDSIPIEFDTPLYGMEGFKFKTYVTGPDGIRKMTNTWTPTVEGEYRIKVDAVGKGFIFTNAHKFFAVVPTQ